MFTVWMGTSRAHTILYKKELGWMQAMSLLALYGSSNHSASFRLSQHIDGKNFTVATGYGCDAIQRYGWVLQDGDREAFEQLLVKQAEAALVKREADRAWGRVAQQIGLPLPPKKETPEPKKWQKAREKREAEQRAAQEAAFMAFN